MTVEKCTLEQKLQIDKIVEKIKEATEGEYPDLAITALTHIVALVTIHDTPYSLQDVINILTVNYNNCVEHIKKGGAH
jgi:hypothetical protein